MGAYCSSHSMSCTSVSHFSEGPVRSSGSDSREVHVGGSQGFAELFAAGLWGSSIGASAASSPSFGGVTCVEGGWGCWDSDSLICPIWFRSSAAKRRSSA